MTHLSRQFCAASAICAAFFAVAASGAVLYVDVNNTNPIAPYSSWSTAAANLQDAVDAASAGDNILVANGTYSSPGRSTDGVTSNAITVTKALAIQSTNGPATTSITGGGTIRCVYLADGATLSGFTLSNGFSPRNAGGAFCETMKSILTNCIVSGNNAVDSAGGVFGGTVLGSALINNQAGTNGGGAYSSTLTGCTVSSNVCAGGFVIPNGDHSGNGAGLYLCTASFCSLNGNSNGGPGGGAASSTLSNCVINGNQSFGTGGATNCTLNNCLLINNYGFFNTGGVDGSTVINSTLSGNASALAYASAVSSTLINSLICSNFSNLGVVNSCVLTNCTIVGNFNNYFSGGVVQGSQLFNCISYFNTNYSGATPGNYTGSTLNYCCTTPLPSAGAGNITNDPAIQADGLHLSAGSLCRGAGNPLYTAGVDIDGQAWLNPPSIGCDEFYTNAVPAVVLQANYTNVLVSYPLSFQGAVTGDQPAFVSWNFGDGTVSNNSLAALHSWSAPGDYTVSLTAFFSDGPLPVMATQVIHVLTNDIPVIQSQPTDQTVTVGNTAQFNVVATGAALLNYQWQFNGTNITGATNASVTLFNVQTNEAGAYSVIVTDPVCYPPGQITSSNAFLTVIATAVCATPPPGLVSWWRAEGDFTDTVDSNNGVGQNVTFSTGKVGQAFAFADGASSISVPASPTLNVGNAGGFTIECWIQPDAFGLTNLGPIIEWGSNTPVGVQFLAGSNLYANITEISGIPHIVQSATGLLNTNYWQHVALTYNKNSSAGILYLNGNMVASNNCGNITPQTTLDVHVGQSILSDGTTNGYGGLIDELSIYDRALSQAEILAIYNAAGAGKCNVPVAPTILVQPASTNVLPGSTTGFSVVATGSSPLNYQWFVNSALITGETNSTLTLSNVDYSEQSNSYSVTISNAGGSVTSSNALLAVIDTPPFISSLPNLGVPFFAPTATNGFTVSDIESPASSLVVSGFSSNTNLVPNNQIVFGGTNSVRTVIVSGISNEIAITTITVVVTDPGGLSTSNSFTFASTNALPQISSIAAQEGPLNATILIPFTVSDLGIPASNLVVTAKSSNTSVVPTNQMVLGGSDTNRTLTIMPGTNMAGTATVTLTVRDPVGGTNSTSFNVQLDQFTQIAALGLGPVFQMSAAAWGDYDNDGKLDLLITGTTNGNVTGAITRIYHNDGGVFTNFISLPGVYQSAVAWSDYDRDGFLDFAISGLNTSNVPVTLIYHNNGDGTFTNIPAGLIGAYSGSLAWGDFNNDGAPDLFICGITNRNTSTNVSKLYRNNGDGTFTDMKANLPGCNSGSAIWGDFDNNGTVDLLLAAPGLTPASVRLYRHLGNGVFTNVLNLITGVSGGPNSATVGDFNNDGWLDFVISGPSTSVYRNNQNGTFSVVATLPTGAASTAIAGDFDNDGYMDLIVGESPSRFYHNNHNNTFTQVGATLPSVPGSFMAAGDFNNDGRLDLAFVGTASNTDAGLWRNDNVTADAPPIAPAGLAAVNVQSNSVMLSWSASVDAQTSSNGVSYNLRVGTTPGGVDVVPPLADPATGQRRVAAMGNAGLTNSALLIDLPKGIYYWSVQAVDVAFEGSSFGTEGSFEITNSRPGISTIADQTIAPLSPLTVPFSIADADNTPGQLSVTVQSSNTNVVPLTNIVLSVPNPAFPSNYVAQITAITNGTSIIAITVSDPQGAFATALFSVTAAQFSLLPANLVPVQQSFIACGDFDNDGNLDFLIAGITNANPNLPVTQLYRNLGGGVFAPVATTLPNVVSGSAAWGDFDNSGKLGLALTGATNGILLSGITRIYRNNGGGSFTDIGATLPGVVSGAVAWGDFDNDGRLDLLLTGSTNSSISGGIARLYRNMGDGTFSNAFTFPGVYRSAVAFADFDGDGFPDVVIAGEGINGAALAMVYRNNGGKSFTLMTNLTGVYNCSVSIGDFDNDGRPDILLAGYNGLYITRVYRNTGNFNFTDIAAQLPGEELGSVAWGDVDADGRLDILICGTGNGALSGAFTRVYHDTRTPSLSQTFTNFALYSSALITNYLGAAAWGDFENRGVLDVLSVGGGYPPGATIPSQTLLFHNNSANSNTPPSAPTGLSFARTNTTVLLAWNQSTDAQTTNAGGLNYQVRIGTTPGGIDIKSPPADPLTGHRRVVQSGDTFTTGWNINGLAPGTYYWSVQAVDTTFAGSPFSAESTFTVLPPPIAIPDAFFTPSNTPAIFPAANLTANDIDLSGLPLTVIAVASNSASGGTVSLNAGTVTYTPPVNFGGNDTFWYSISDGQSATAVSTVTATVGSGGMVWLQVVSDPLVDSNGNFALRLQGVPGLTYTIEGAPSPTGPWTKITNLTAPQTDQGFGVGVFEFTQPANSMAQFYRIIYPSY